MPRRIQKESESKASLSDSPSSASDPHDQEAPDKRAQKEERKAERKAQREERKAERKAQRAERKAQSKTVKMIEESDHDKSDSEVVAVEEAPVVMGSWAESVSEQQEVPLELKPVVEETLPLPADSIARFDREEVAVYEDQVAKDLSLEQMLKLLIRRGELQLNPALAKGAEKLLRQLNREQIHPPRRHPRPRRNRRGRFPKPHSDHEK